MPNPGEPEGRAGDRDRAVFALSFAAIVALGLWLRLAGLTDKPLHYDEGVNGWFSLKLYWWNDYRYQPSDYHGPLLHYANLLCFHLLGPSEFSLRLASALAGALVPLALLPARRLAGNAATLAAALLLAVGPGLVYFSRTAIHEIYLVFFTALWAAALARFAARPGWGWALSAAAAAAACFASKETALLTAGSLAAGAALAWLAGAPAATGDLFGGRTRAAALRAWTLEAPRAWLVGGVVFGALLVLFFSSFFSNWGGVADFPRAYAPWVEYGVTGRNQAKSFGYFGDVGAVTQDGARWLAVGAALFAGLRRHRLGLALAGWSAAALGVYSVIPYKTPWCVLQIDLPVFLLAGWGLGQLWELTREAQHPRGWAAVAGALCLAPAGLLLGRSIEDNRARFDDSRRPYVYYQTFAPFHDLLRDVLAAGSAAGDEPGGPRMLNIGLEFPLRFYTATRGWWPDRTRWLEDAPTSLEPGETAMVLADSEHLDAVEDLLAAQPGRWHRERYFFRPGLLAFVFYDRDVWDRFEAAGGPAAARWPRPPMRPLPAPP